MEDVSDTENSAEVEQSEKRVPVVTPATAAWEVRNKYFFFSN
jgi:hypothetical protein